MLRWMASGWQEIKWGCSYMLKESNILHIKSFQDLPVVRIVIHAAKRSRAGAVLKPRSYMSES